MLFAFFSTRIQYNTKGEKNRKKLDVIIVKVINSLLKQVIIFVSKVELVKVMLLGFLTNESKSDFIFDRNLLISENIIMKDRLEISLISLSYFKRGRKVPIIQKINGDGDKMEKLNEKLKRKRIISFYYLIRKF